MAQREVVLDRVVGIVAPERGRDLFGSRPRGGEPPGQAQVAADPVDVRVDWDHELRGRDGPKPQVHAVRWTYHPARVEQESFAGASCARIAHQVSKVAGLRITAKCVGETSHRLAKIGAGCFVETDKRLPQTSVHTNQSSGVPQHRCEVLISVNSMNEASEPLEDLVAVGLHDGRCRVRSERRKYSFDTTPCGQGVAEREARGDQTGELLVDGLVVLMDEVDRILLTAYRWIAFMEQRFQSFTDRIHFVGVLAILPTRLQ